MDKKELFKIADELKADADRRARLVRWLGNRTEVEMISICSKSANWFYLFRDYPETDRGQKEFLRFLCAAAWRRSHYSHNAKYLALVCDERDARKTERKSLFGKIKEDLDEIEEMKTTGLTWEEIRKKLKEKHRRKYYKIKLTEETLRKYYRQAKEKNDG